MKDFLFENTETGDEFFVECKTLEEAWDIIKNNFEWVDCQFIEYSNTWVTPSEADVWGLDTF